jgi:hypothetical protein
VELGEKMKLAHSLTPYVARRCYAYWLERAGIHPTRVRIYMGHATKDMTGRYTDHEVPADELAADVNLLRDYIKRGQKKAMAVEQGAPQKKGAQRKAAKSAVAVAV